MFRNWRICPDSSRTWRERAGKRVVSSLSAAATVAAEQSIFGAPSVKRRKAVGISMLTGIFSCSFACHGRHGELLIEQRFKSFEARRNGFGERVFGDERVGGLQAVASDAHHRGFVTPNTALRQKLLRYACGYAACGLREDAFAFRELLDRGDDFWIGNVFGPAAGLAD